MLKNVYIDLKTKEVINSKNTNYIACDEKMIDVILMLYDKGYDVKYSCSGHIEDLLYYEEEYPIEKREYLDKETDLEFVREKDGKLVYRGLAWLGTNIYISFNKDYRFERLPEGFKEERDSRYVIRKYYPTQDESGNKYTLEELNKIQDDTISDLYEWAKNLKSINEEEI